MELLSRPLYSSESRQTRPACSRRGRVGTWISTCWGSHDGTTTGCGRYPCHRSHLRCPTPEKLENHLAALVHHVELSKDGWRDRALELLILATCFSAKNLLLRLDICSSLNEQLKVPIGRAQVESAVNHLCQRGSLVEVEDGRCKLAEATWAELEANFDTAANVERDVIASFKKHFERFADDHGLSWDQFRSNFLDPLVSELGARTYELISGGGTAAEDARAHRRFLESFAVDRRATLAAAISSFFDAADPPLRRFVLNRLNATFLVRATALGEATLRALTEASKRSLVMSVFVDTNFLFSLVGLHENPADDVVDALNSIIRRTGGKTDVKLYVLPITLDEARETIANKKDQLSGILIDSVLARAVHLGTLDCSSMTLKYFREAMKATNPLSASEFFEPYLRNLVEICRAHGVELYNADVSNLQEDQKVIDDLLEERNWQEGRRPKGAKPYPVIHHDMVLWHFVDGKRHAGVESPVEARFWIATIDFGFLSFDRHKKRVLGRSLPLAVHPTVLLQMLQFWVPQSAELELALINSLQPMLPHEFDAGAERVSIKILRALSRYSNISSLGEETVGRIFEDEVVRTRVKESEDIEEHINVVESAIIEQAGRLRRETDGLRQETKKLRDTKKVLERELERRTAEIERLQAEIVEAGKGRDEGMERLQEEENRIQQLLERMHLLEEEGRQRLLGDCCSSSQNLVCGGDVDFFVRVPMALGSLCSGFPWARDESQSYCGNGCEHCPWISADFSKRRADRKPLAPH